MRLKQSSNRIFGRTEAEVSYKYVFQFLFSFLKSQGNESRQDRTRAIRPDYRKMPKSTGC
jgi:hypothetical protein